jgi:hypothetical protein
MAQHRPAGEEGKLLGPGGAETAAAAGRHEKGNASHTAGLAQPCDASQGLRNQSVFMPD